MNDISISKQLSYLLRHGAAKAGLKMERDGFVKVEDILRQVKVSFVRLQQIVKTNDKQRFQMLQKNNIWYIRANQGHSINTVVAEELLHEVTNPADIPLCIHGTYQKNLPSIMKNGLSRMSRNHIHFARGMFGDKNVTSGMRKDCDAFLSINVEKCMKDGFKFYISNNGVILSAGNDQGIITKEYFDVIPDKYII